MKKYDSLLEVKNPTKGQLIYMEGLYTHEQLIQYMAIRWEHKFNWGSLTEDDLHRFHYECDILKLNSLEVTSNMTDYGVI